MKRIEWNKEKNEWLINNRNISFEQIAECIYNENIVNIIDHSNKSKYSNKKKFVIKIGDYCYGVPFVEDDNKVFLKTAFPSRKLTKIHITNL